MLGELITYSVSNHFEMTFGDVAHVIYSSMNNISRIARHCSCPLTVAHDLQIKRTFKVILRHKLCKTMPIFTLRFDLPIRQLIFLIQKFCSIKFKNCIRIINTLRTMNANKQFFFFKNCSCEICF